MTSGPRVEYWGASAARGPLLVIEGVDGVGWDEVGEVRLDSGEVRHGVVLDVHRDWAVVEVFQGTEGLRLDEVRVSFSGSPLRVPVGEAWLGRVCNGRGDPLDGPPPILAREHRGVAGRPINPAVRETPRDPILTGVCAIDGLATLVRGQKLPIFSVGGLPHLELAAQVAAQAHVSEGEPFAVVFAAIGITHADAAGVQDILEQRASSGDITLFVNTIDDPLVERIATPRIALTVAEHLAFDLGRHVLVVISDVTSYCEALREVSAARGEVPSRRGYPGYLYSDLASIYERAGRVRSRPGLGHAASRPHDARGRHHPPGPGPHRVHHRGPARARPGAACEGRVPAVRPPRLPVAPHAARSGPGENARRPPGDRGPALRARRARPPGRRPRRRRRRGRARSRRAAPARILGRLQPRLPGPVGNGLPLPRGHARAAWRVAATLPRRELTMVSRASLDAYYPRDAEHEDAPADAAG